MRQTGPSERFIKNKKNKNLKLGAGTARSLEISAEISRLLPLSCLQNENSHPKPTKKSYQSSESRTHGTYTHTHALVSAKWGPPVFVFLPSHGDPFQVTPAFRGWRTIKAVMTLIFFTPMESPAFDSVPQVDWLIT
jgi:hypothetical protein